MTIRSTLKGLIVRGARLAASQAAQAGREDRNVDICLAGALEEPGALTRIRYPAAYVDFLRTCIDYMTCSVEDVRTDGPDNDSMSKRWTTLLDVLRSDVPPISFATAQSIALVADRYRGLSDPVEYGQWAGDTGLLFSISSSFGKKGRILSSIVRLTRRERCLELGTAFGMSALFILSTLKAQGGIGHVTTLEGLEPQFSLAAAMLKDQYGDMVSCHLGMTDQVLPELAKSMGSIDFLFHDAGHSREDYVRDFDAVIDVLSHEGIVLVDDIRWEDARFSSQPAETYRGWREVVAHPRVRRAVEINGSLGLLLLR
jgi:predicted O-methyltransferase YrrM